MTSVSTVLLCAGIALAPVSQTRAAPAPAPAPAPEPATPPAAPSTEASPTPAARPAAIDLPPPRSERTHDQDAAKPSRGADALIGLGATSLTLGAMTLLVVAWPAWSLRNRALDKARDAELRAETAEYAEKADNRRHVAVIALAIGTSLSAVGIAMITGGVIKRRRARQLSLVPAVGGGFAGASATLRF